jgi:hypothetical protein
MKTLRRYWFDFEAIAEPSPLNLGCGVTAHDYDDAVALLTSHVLSGQPLLRIRRVLSDIDISTLDEKHVLPNIGSVLVRGIWFPLGFGPSERV